MGSQPSLPEVNLADKTIVVTGANTGIGYETAKALAQAGAKVIVACRSESKATEAIEQMKKEHAEEKADPKKQRVQIKVDDINVEFMALDLGSLQSTMTFIEAYRSKGLPLHVLVCNAGIMWGPEELTSDGYEPHFQINYLSHFLLILHLLPVLKSSGPGARVVSVSSLMYRFASWNANDLQCLKNNDRGKRYSNSKCYQAMERMKKEHSEEKAEPKKSKVNIKADDLDVEFMTLDLSSIASTMSFVEAFKAKGLPLHVLVCNAGIVYGGEAQTADGFEIHFQVNYLSHFLLTLHLLPVLKASGGNAKVVLVSSMAYRQVGWHEENIQSNNKDQMTRYGSTKLYQIMEMFTLAEKLEGTGIGVFSLHPGFVDSDIFKKENQQISGPTKFVVGMLASIKLSRNTFDGALTTIHAAADPQYDGKTALYFENTKPTRLKSSVATNKDKQEFLWKYSLDCLKDYVTEDTLKELTSQ